MEKTLFILAGPNGAGKSTFGPVLVGGLIEYFNGDIVHEDYIKRNPNDSVNDATEHLDSIFRGKIQAAIRDQKSFAYETNFADGNAMATPQYFKLNGYKIHLIYFCLPSLKDSMNRVLKRHIEKIGHNVTPELIEHNYKIGHYKVENYFKQFDKVTIFDNTTSSVIKGPRRLIELENGIPIFAKSFLPKYIQVIFPKITELVKIHIKPRLIKPKRRGMRF